MTTLASVWSTAAEQGAGALVDEAPTARASAEEPALSVELQPAVVARTARSATTLARPARGARAFAEGSSTRATITAHPKPGLRVR